MLRANPTSSKASKATLAEVRVDAGSAKGAGAQTPSAAERHPPPFDFSRPAPVVVPIRSLGPAHRDRIAQHLLSLNERDRYLRFGYPANDEQIRRYVDGINFHRDEVFGIYNRELRLIAVVHLAFTVSRDLSMGAEFGVSVASSSRGRGFGARLFERAARHARNEGVESLFIHALIENRAMLSIARKAGAVIERNGSEAEAFLRLPPATLESRVTEIIEEQLAVTDYTVKVQARQFRRLLAGFQAG